MAECVSRCESVSRKERSQYYRKKYTYKYRCEVRY